MHVWFFRRFDILYMNLSVMNRIGGSLETKPFSNPPVKRFIDEIEDKPACIATFNVRPTASYRGRTMNSNNREGTGAFSKLGLGIGKGIGMKRLTGPPDFSLTERNTTIVIFCYFTIKARFCLFFPSFQVSLSTAVLLYTYFWDDSLLHQLSYSLL